MSHYSGLSNVSPEDLQRLHEIATGTGDGIVIIEDEGTPINPIANTVDFQGGGTRVTPLIDRTIITVDGGIASPSPAHYKANRNLTITGPEPVVALEIMTPEFSVGTDWLDDSPFFQGFNV